MASSMALASGVLLFSSLAILFPQAQKRLDNDALLYTCYFGGATFTLLLTRLIHYLMPDAIHACGEAAENCHHPDGVEHSDHHHTSDRTGEERRKLKDHACDVEYGTIRSSESHFRFHHDDPSNPNSCAEDVNNGANNDHNHHHHHHHHHETVEETVINHPGHFYSIGFQTAIAICVHKFPGI